MSRRKMDTKLVATDTLDSCSKIDEKPQVLSAKLTMKKKKQKFDHDDDLELLSKEELISRVIQLQAHVQQLKNIITKQKMQESKTVNNKPVKSFDFKRYKKRHVALKLLYLGWEYQGFAAQEDTNRTIETQLFNALMKTRLIESRETSNYHRCGRTDKGVSAFSQVISLDLRSNCLEGKGIFVPDGYAEGNKKDGQCEEIHYVQILNKVLPPEIRIIAWAPVVNSFSARFDCLKRTYKYFFPKGDLNIEKMEEAAQYLVGEHDFRNLCKMDVGNGVVNYNRNILQAIISPLTPSSDKGYQLFELTVVGQAFLWHQIRCITAILFLVGQGKEKPTIILDLLDVKQHPRKPQYTMAAELPLVLFDCQFPDVQWQYDTDGLNSLIRHLQNHWTNHCIRTTIIKQMLTDLENLHGEHTESISCQTEYLTMGAKPRIYKPLLERPHCESLEDRIQHYAKRQKITQDSESSSEKATSILKILF
ncbi:tRNA pseudouridine(38/39) synthase isoform X2 [Tachypleus tridentatus]|uniref:tRNA pseudouridine(38/39) synthase isoform X2 n=2 Tax=Tachypleus tridentatus TaxID=6853 RepID=UPI003FD2C665